MRIGFDCDGVLYDFLSAARRFVPVHTLTPDPQSYYVHEAWQIDGIEFNNYALESIRRHDLFWEGEPLPQAREIVNAFYDEGHETFIITHRGSLGETLDEARQATEYWLHKHDFHYTELVIAGDKTSVWTDAMVEDRVENFLALESVGTDAYLLDQTWNRHCETKKRVKDLREFRRRVLH